MKAIKIIAAMSLAIAATGCASVPSNNVAQAAYVCKDKPAHMRGYSDEKNNCAVRGNVQELSAIDYVKAPAQFKGVQ